MGGIMAACLLARAGRSVVVFDRSPEAGGASRVLSLDGCRFEPGTSFLTGLGPSGPATLLCQRLGLALPTVETEPALQVALRRHRISFWQDSDRWWREIRREFPEDEAGWRALLARLDEQLASRERILGVAPSLPPEQWPTRLRWWLRSRLGKMVGAQASAWRMVGRAMATPFRATLDEIALGPASRQVLEAVLWYLLLRTTEECSTLEAAVALEDVRRRGATIRGGVETLMDSLLRQFERDGGQLRLGAEIAGCLVRRGRVLGVVTAQQETVQARWVVSDVPPAVLAEWLLPPTARWLQRPRGGDSARQVTHVAEGVAAVFPASLCPSELRAHCVVVPDPDRPAREENLVFVHVAQAPEEGFPADSICLSAGRYVPASSGGPAARGGGALLAAVDQIIPGIEQSAGFPRTLDPGRLAELWGRPTAAVRYAGTVPEWLGRRAGAPPACAPRGLLTVGEWWGPGRLLSAIAEGAMQVADRILGGS